LTLQPFTLLGATTRSGLLTAPLRARFGIQCHLEYYNAAVLKKIVLRSAGILDVEIDEQAAQEIASRSRVHHVLPTLCLEGYAILHK